ncbi:MAG: transposase family protein [Myxococcota bacterium]
MTVIMDDTHITTLEQVKEVLGSAQAIAFKGVRREQVYRWIEGILKRFDYFELGRKHKGLVKAYLGRLSGFSRAQLTRLLLKYLLEGAIRPSRGRRNRFPAKYTDADKELLAHTDNAHGRLSGPATKRILERESAVYGDKRFARLQGISVAHIYRLRRSRRYRQQAQTFAKTRSVCLPIGVRHKPNPQGRPGWLRVDTVHQGDLDGKKGVYHVNLVDEVTQWEVVVCVEAISEAHLEPALARALMMFPFVILGFHSDNGSEYINYVVAKLLNGLLIRQTKSRSGRTNDNALVEGKNGSVIRKHMGYWHIPGNHAPLIQRFYEEHFNPYLNFHRPCGFATVRVDEKGRRRKKYETYQTPYERLRTIVKGMNEKAARECLRKGVTLEVLDKISAKRTDNEAASAMQAARARLFRRIGSRRGLPTSHSNHHKEGTVPFGTPSA